MSLKIKEEVKKQFDARFLIVTKYPEWVANIVLVPKKDGKVQICVDYQVLRMIFHCHRSMFFMIILLGM